MLTSVITFEIRDFAAGIAEEFIVPNVPGAYELIASCRYSRSIEFTEQFSFQKTRVPDFIVEELFAEYLAKYELENELDEADEMMGVY